VRGVLRKTGRKAFYFVFVNLQCYDQEFGGSARRAASAAERSKPEQARTSSNHSLTGYEGEHTHGS
jgi:hypothetical protein